jgi:glutamate/tyrosine decarboxylase-like PLP-dependent enzyme
MGCGMFFTRESEVLSSAFHTSAAYMPSGDRKADPYLTSVQWSRRFLGLRLFMSLAAAGWRGYGQHVERAIDLIALLRDALSARGWSIRNRSPLAVLCFTPSDKPGEVPVIVRRVLASGRAWISTAMFEGSQVIRACATNGETMPEDVMELVDALETARYGRTDGLRGGAMPANPAIRRARQLNPAAPQ